MNFLATLLRGIAFVPAVVNGAEALFGAQSGADKKQAALSFVGSALNVGEAITQKEIVDESSFTDGLGKVIDGVVQCLNASTWAKAK